MLHSLQENKISLSHNGTRESENNVKHLSSGGDPGGIFLSCHSSFEISRVSANI